MALFHPRNSASPKTRQQALECIPVKNPEAVESRNGNGDVLLTYPVHIRPLFSFVRRLLPERPVEKGLSKKLQLDGLGTVVWELIDGKKSVKTIIRAFARSRKLEKRESEVAITQFIKDLGKRGLVGLKEGPPPD
jgi:hypothetical protein